ncbi:hypothetical protein MIAR_28650 [Microbacterium arabinogalactanolyticum]|nr:hypothetical protein MIAR_28650 [Microbacterium arabinogalactanolyticum]
MVVDLGDDVCPPGHLGVEPAEEVDPLEVDLVEVEWQVQGGDLLAGGVAEGGADDALVDGTHEEVLSVSGPPKPAGEVGRARMRVRPEMRAVPEAGYAEKKMSPDAGHDASPVTGVPPPDRSQPLPSARDAPTITSRATKAPSANSTSPSVRRLRSR